MKVVNLLEFINKAKDLYTLDYANFVGVNFLDLITEDEQFTQKIDLGVIYVSQKTFDQYTIVDGLNRIVSLSLLLHAVCECYKKTTVQNEKAIKTIRNKYLLSGNKLKLRLFDNSIYSKIIFGERLSGHEKQSAMFQLLHGFWSQIKSENLQAASIFTMLKKIFVTVVETDGVSKRNLYYKLNNNRELNQLVLITDFLRENGIDDKWNLIKNKYFVNDNDLIQFLNNFFITKFNYKKFRQERLYENFVNYFETMMQYMPEDIIIKKIKNSAALYSDIINVNFKSEDVKQAFIKIKKYSGEDTYAYILEVYEDYMTGSISESTFIEILDTISDYLKTRQNTNNDVSFNELIQYLNAFITCK